MSWGMFGGLFGGRHGLYGGGSYHMAHEAASQASKSKSAARQALEAARIAEERVEKLTLVCAAMWTLIRDRSQLTEEDLAAAIRELDLKDGTEDGKVTQRIVKCPQCGRTMHPRHHRCLYCGTEGLKDTAFDGV